MEKFIELFKANVNVLDLKNSLMVTCQGLAAIFIVMAVIALIVYVFAKVSSFKK